MLLPRVFHDFQSTDPSGRLRLNCQGTIDDLAQHQIELREGLALTFYCEDANDGGAADELLVDGVAAYSTEEKCWVAMIDWNAIRHSSLETTIPPNVATRSLAPDPVRGHF